RHVTHEVRCERPAAHGAGPPRVQRDAALTEILIEHGDGGERAGSDDLAAEAVAIVQPGNAELGGAGESGGIAGEPIDPSLKLIRSRSADPQLVSDLGDRKAEPRAKRAVERQRARHRDPLAGGAVTTEHPDRAGATI